MNSNWKITLSGIIQKSVDLKIVYSDDKYSYRIEGQMGGEVMIQCFTNLYIYLQRSNKLSEINLLKELIQFCIKECNKINRKNVLIKTTIYSFNEKDGRLKSIPLKLFLGTADSGVQTDEDWKTFVTSEEKGDIRSIVQLTLPNAQLIAQNSLLVFITDEYGCELSEELRKKYRKFSEKSIWIKLQDTVDVVRGFPQKIS